MQRSLDSLDLFFYLSIYIICTQILTYIHTYIQVPDLLKGSIISRLLPAAYSLLRGLEAGRIHRIL